LGPWGESPDLRNRGCYYCPCSTGDIIIVVTDGIHDNLDPENLGISPKDLGYEDNWENLPNTDFIKSQYCCSVLQKILDNCSSPEAVGPKLIDYAIIITKKS